MHRFALVRARSWQGPLSVIRAGVGRRAFWREWGQMRGSPRSMS